MPLSASATQQKVFINYFLTLPPSPNTTQCQIAVFHFSISHQRGVESNLANLSDRWTASLNRSNLMMTLLSAEQGMNIYFASSFFLRAIFHQFPREKSGGSEKLCSLVRMNNYPSYSGQEQRPARAGAGQFAVPFFSCSVSDYN